MTEEYENNPDWKKIFSQDGSYFYVNKSTGQKKRPKVVNTLLNINTTEDNGKSEAARAQSNMVSSSPKTSLNSGGSDIYFMQYTADRIPFYVHTRTGISSWELPEGVSQSAIKFITHFTENGEVYYEDVEKGITSWTFPVEKLSTAARRSSVALQKMNRQQSELFISNDNESGSGSLNGIRSSSDAEKDHNHRKENDSSLIKLDRESSNAIKSGRVSPNPNPAQKSSKSLKAEESLGSKKYANIASRKPFQEPNSDNESDEDVGNQDGKGKLSEMRALRAVKRRDASTRNLKPSLKGGRLPPRDSQTITETAPTATATTTTMASSSLAHKSGDESSQEDRDSVSSRRPFSNSPLTTGAISAKRGETSSSAGPASGPVSVDSSKVMGSQLFTHDPTKPLVRIVFEKYDVSRKGYLSLNELQEICYDYGTYLPMEDIRVAMHGLDSNGDGSLQYEEFMVWWRSNERLSLVKLNDEKHLKRQNVVNIFKKYDCDITGVISRQDFQLMYRDLVRQQLTKTELDSAIQLLDPTGTGYVQFNDYVLWMENPHTAKSKISDANKGGKTSLFSSMFSLLRPKSNDVVNIAEPMCAAKDHPDYKKYFRMVSLGGSTGSAEIRAEMRSKGLDESLLQTPERIIPAKSIFADQTRASMLLLNAADKEDDFDGDEVLEPISKAVNINSNYTEHVPEENRHVNDADFLSMFKKKTVPIPKADGFIRLSIMKPLGMTLGENEPNEPKGVHVDSLVSGGNAEGTGQLRHGLQVIEIANTNVENLDFDDIMDVLRGLDGSKPVDIVFKDPAVDDNEEMSVAEAANDLQESVESKEKLTSSIEVLNVQPEHDRAEDDRQTEQQQYEDEEENMQAFFANENRGTGDSPEKSTPVRRFSARKAAAIKSAVKRKNSFEQTSLERISNPNTEDEEEQEQYRDVAADQVDPPVEEVQVTAPVDNSISSQQKSARPLFTLPQDIVVAVAEDYFDPTGGPTDSFDSTLDNSVLSSRARVPKQTVRKNPSLLRRAVSDVGPRGGSHAVESMQGVHSVLDDKSVNISNPLFQATTTTRISDAAKKHIETQVQESPTASSTRLSSFRYEDQAFSATNAPYSGQEETSPANSAYRNNQARQKSHLERSDVSLISKKEEYNTNEPRLRASNGVRNSPSRSFFDFAPVSVSRPVSVFNPSSIDNRSISDHRPGKTTVSGIFAQRHVENATQTDYTNIILDEEYLNSYQMLLGEKSELCYMREDFHREVEERERMFACDYESMVERINHLKALAMEDLRYQEYEYKQSLQVQHDILMQEREEVSHLWEELHRAEEMSKETQNRRTSEILDLMHILMAHHEKIHGDKRKIARQRMQLDMALQDLNKFNSFTADSKKANGHNSARWASPGGTRRSRTPSNR